MDRREALFGTGMLALSALAAADRAAAQDHAHMHHGGGQYKALADAAGACVSSGQVCVNGPGATVHHHVSVGEFDEVTG
jgi:hypothetical protein